MRLFLLFLFACAGTMHPAVDERPVETIAVAFGRAMIAGDRAGAVALSLTWDDMGKLSKKASERDAAWWNGELDDFLKRMAAPGTQVVDARVLERKTLTPNDNSKVLRATDVAIVELRGEGGASIGHALLFIKSDRGWRFSPMH